MTRSIAELAEVGDPAWPQVEEAVAASPVAVRMLALDRASGERVLYRLQVTARSGLGALALNCGGLVVEQGWLRLLGGGGPGLLDLASANGLGEPHEGSASPGLMVVAYDVIGGCFAIDGGALGGEPGQVSYWGPDTLTWTALGVGHMQFVLWALAGGTREFYADLRWPGWVDEVSGLDLDEGISCVPFLFTEQGQDIAAVSRRPVPLRELLDLFGPGGTVAGQFDAPP